MHSHVHYYSIIRGPNGVRGGRCARRLRCGRSLSTDGVGHGLVMDQHLKKQRGREQCPCRTHRCRANLALIRHEAAGAGDNQGAGGGDWRAGKDNWRAERRRDPPGRTPGTKPSCPIVSICTKSRRISASASEIQGPGTATWSRSARLKRQAARSKKKRPAWPHARYQIVFSYRLYFYQKLPDFGERQCK